MKTAKISITPHSSNRVWIDRSEITRENWEILNSLSIWGGADAFVWGNSEKTSVEDISWEFETKVNLIEILENLGFNVELI